MTAFGPVEKGVPIPSTRGPLRIALADLDKGDSRYITGYKRNNIQTAARRNGIVVRVHTEGDGFRVWRIS